MPVRVVVTCAGCGKEKGDVNHWWGVHADPPTSVQSPQEFIIRPFTLVDARAGYESYCGQQCLTKALSEWMDERAKFAQTAQIRSTLAPDVPKGEQT